MPRPRLSAGGRLALLAASLVVSGVAGAAGLRTVTLPAAAGGPAIKAAIWTPCAAKPQPIDLGDYSLPATRDCAVAGTALPLVVISHGQGGSMLGHYDTALALADAGFVVVSLNHPGDWFGDDSKAQELQIFESRPRDVSRAITYMLQQWPERSRLAPGAVGVFGFSRGGYTALALAGAVPSLPASDERYCDAWWSYVLQLCREVKSGASLRPAADARVRAAVVVDPLNLFDAAGLKHVRIPVQLWASELGGDGVQLAHVEAVRASAPGVREFHVARGAGHFAYLVPCPPEWAESATKICKDPAGFDRTQWHRTMNAAVVRFFSQQLRPATPPAH